MFDLTSFGRKSNKEGVHVAIRHFQGAPETVQIIVCMYMHFVPCCRKQLRLLFLFTHP
jgi:hypothetical protein